MDKKTILQTSLEHKQPESVPIDFGGTATTGIHVQCVDALRKHYGLDPHPVKVHEPYQMLGFIEDDLKDALGICVDSIVPHNTMFGFPNENWKEWRMPNGLEVLVSEHFQTTQDADGNFYIYPQGDTSAPPSGKMPNDGYFFDTVVRQEPIDEANLTVEDNCEEFGPISDQELQSLKNQLTQLQHSSRGIVATFGGTAFGDIALVPAPFLKHPKGIRDIEEWYISTATRQNFIHKIFEKQCQYALDNLPKIHAALGDAIDAVFICGTDFGTQQGTFCSLKTYQSLYMPYYKQVNDWIHKHTTWKTFKHSCGAVEPFINAFIESGFDILNPVQCSAAGMEATHLKKTYGDRIVFWGGGIDTQKTLPYGTPQQVKDEVRSRCDIFAEGGGFVFNAVHNVQANTPIENLIAMFETLKEYNK